MLHPLLLVEALLINSRIEWAGQVIRQLRANEHLADISLADTPILERRLALPGVMGEERDGDPFTTLLMFYCDKALEFPQSAIVLSTPAESECRGVAWYRGVASCFSSHSCCSQLSRNLPPFSGGGINRPCTISGGITGLPWSTKIPSPSYGAL